jgi:hypothetical protein
MKYIEYNIRIIKKAKYTSHNKRLTLRRHSAAPGFRSASRTETQNARLGHFAVTVC